MKKYIIYSLSVIFLASGTMDLISDNSNDLLYPIVESPGELSSDNDEVFQAIGKGILSLITVILGSITETTLISKKISNHKFHTRSIIKIDRNTNLAMESDKLMSLYLNNHEPEFKKLVLSKFEPDLKKDIAIEEITFEKFDDQVTTTMITNVQIADLSKQYANVLSNRLSDVFEEIIGEKFDRIEKFSRENKTSIERATKEIIALQIREFNALMKRQ